MLNRLIKNESVYNASIAALSSIGLVLLLGRQDWWPGYYSPHFFGVAFMISALIILAARFIFRSSDACRANSANFLRFVIMLSLIINTAGELYFYQLYRFGFQFDKFAHLANSFLFIIALISFGQAWLAYDPAKALKLSIAIVVMCGIGWELTEFLSDKLLRTKEFGVYGEMKLIDTVFDIIYNLLGITLAAMVQKSPSFRLKLELETCEPASDILAEPSEADAENEKSPF